MPAPWTLSYQLAFWLHHRLAKFYATYPCLYALKARISGSHPVLFCRNLYRYNVAMKILAI